ncbi:PEP_CTERM-anchored TLD domain-containing protein [Methylomonas sp. UP202]|nr:PEP_CTERM-anchored TLD domain-containing protein [Methylomonas sp. UP202]WGS84647.1 PEP_CTERM-anchored TLD domain-containing protein [Methylomonas sp. UP202]
MQHQNHMMTTVCLSGVLLAASVMPAQAAIIVGGSSLLTETYLSQLENQLGEGPIALTNIFTKSPGATSVDFHNAVDNKGRTFVVMQAAEDNGNTAVIGGYNPESWNSVAHTNPSQTSSFLFNLSDSQFFLQLGAYITLNQSSYGPSFGSGYDIFVDSSLNNGYSYLATYTNTSSGNSIIDGSHYNGVNVSYGAMEVFTISQVPVPGAAWLFGSAILGLLGLKRRG